MGSNGSKVRTRRDEQGPKRTDSKGLKCIDSKGTKCIDSKGPKRIDSKGPKCIEIQGPTCSNNFTLKSREHRTPEKVSCSACGTILRERRSSDRHITWQLERSDSSDSSSS